jgi:subtilisin-like proprotein convertase family protein
VSVYDLKPLAEVPRVDMPALDLGAIALEDDAREQAGLAPRYAIPNRVRMTPMTAGTWEDVGDGNLVWRLRLISPNAVSVNLGFDAYSMPPGGQLFIYSADEKASIRPFTAKDNALHGELWTPPIATRDVIVEVTVPARERPRLALKLASVNWGYRDFGSFIEASGACNVDVICPEGDDWRDEIASVGVISTGGSTFCTGFMVNNTSYDLTPYFMTADHCGISSGNAASLVVYWNFENSWCRPPGGGPSGGPGDGSLSQFQTGSFFRAGGSSSDFTLVELDEDPDPTWAVAYAGWDATGADHPSAIAIHHPNTDEKRISFEDDPTTTTSYLGSSVPGDGTHVRVEDWDLGTTEPGSSGSPLFSPDHRVIGQLHGGFAACGNNDADWYGKFSISWDTGGSPSSRLVDWLDAAGTGELIVDTISGGGIQVTPAGTVVHKGAIGGPFTDPVVNYTLTNPAPDPADYMVSLGTGTAPVLIDGGTTDVTGTLGGSGGTAIVAVSLDDPASLPQGIYTRDIVFDDLTNGTSKTRTHVVEVGQVGFSTTPAEGLVSGGAVGGPFETTIVYTLTSTEPTGLDVEVSASDSWISINGGAGPATVSLGGIGSSDTVTIGYASAADALPAGLYEGTVSFTSLSGGNDDTTRPVVLDVGRFTYAASGLPTAIPDDGSMSSTIMVSDTFCVGDVNVELAIDHTYVGDLCVELEHDGIVVGMVQRMGASAGDPCHAGSPFGCSENDFDITLDDAAAFGIEDQCAAGLTGTFAPNEPLAAFNSGFVGGAWTLTVRDRAGADTGDLISWTLKIATAGETCPPVANDIEITIPIADPVDIMLDASSIGGDHEYVINSLPAHGVLSDPAGGTIAAVPYTLLGMGDTVTYDPANSFMGTDHFGYLADDGLPSNIADVDITVGGPQVIYDFPLDTDPEWETTGDWAFGVPAGNDNDPSGGVTGINVYGYNLDGAYPNNMGEETLTTPALDCSNLTDVEVHFWRQLGVEHATFDHARFQISTNGSSWMTIWENLAGFENTLNETTWSKHMYDVSAIADNQPTVYLRWVMGTTDGSVVFAGWNLDDIQLLAIEPTPVCPADITGSGGVPDGNVDALDFLMLIGQWGSPCVGSCEADITGSTPLVPDGNVDSLDYLLVIGQWGSPGCPSP